ncbi:MAG: YdcF family protein [Pseudomonadota bacterium]
MRARLDTLVESAGGRERRVKARRRVWVRICLFVLIGALVPVTALVGVVFFHAPTTRAAYDTLALRFERPLSPRWERASGIIVLGGERARFLEGARLALRLGEVPVVLSGPGDIEVETYTRALARGAAWDDGASRSESLSTPRSTSRSTSRPAPLIDRRATSTYGNARFSADVLNPQPGSCWILVTSANHMPRAVASFRAAGFAVAPWPIRDKPDRPHVRQRYLAYETAGLLYYRLTGRTNTLLPERGESCLAG